MKITPKIIKAAISVARKHPFSAIQFDENGRIQINKGYKNRKSYKAELLGCWIPCVIYLKSNEIPNE